MRLIDADALKAKQQEDADLFIGDNTLSGKSRRDEALNAVANIVNAPTIDAVEVVRCKDCKWGRETCGNIECNVDLNVPPEYHSYDWFCPNGE